MIGKSLATLYAFLELRVSDIAGHHKSSTQRQSRLYRVPTSPLVLLLSSFSFFWRDKQEERREII